MRCRFTNDPVRLSESERNAVDAVLETYGDRSAQALARQAQREHPWKSARRGLQPGEHGSQEITHAAMAAYYREFGSPR